MKFFLDTEFIEDGKTIDLISIGVVALGGNVLGKYYAESADVDLSKANAWVRDNVIPHLSGNTTPRKQIRDELVAFVSRFCDESDPPEFYGYYADYDWVALCQLFGTMMDLPSGWPMFCMDLKQMSVMLGSPKHPADPIGEHNALVDAMWNVEFFKTLESARVSV